MSALQAVPRDPAHVPGSTGPQGSISPPQGLLGDVARFIYAAAPRPVPDIAIAGAIGLLAGIVGRSHNVSGTGLNHYVLLLANTGTGKEAIAAGISRIMAALSDPASGNPIPAAASFYGPADMASGQGLLRTLSRRSPPCFVSTIGEFGLRFKLMASERANSSDASLLRALLDLYNKSGRGQIVGETVYSEKEKNTAPIVSPALTIIGESTPESFYQSLDDAMIANGLLPRFNIIEYTGPRVSKNRDAANATVDPCTLEALKRLVTACANANYTNHVTDVAMQPNAEAFLDEFDVYADAQINASQHNVTRELWNRAHVKALKLAALIAVGCDFERPVVTLEMAMWAHEQTERDIRRLIGRFDNNEVGEAGGNEPMQQAKVVACIREYVAGKHERFATYGVTAKMHAHCIVPHSYLSKRLLTLPAFKRDRSGATAALKRTIQALLEAGEIVEVNKNQAVKDFDTSARCYTPQPASPHFEDLFRNAPILNLWSGRTAV